MAELYRAMTPAEKLERVRELTLMSVRLALAGSRTRNPGSSERALLLGLARRRLGPAIAARVYPSAEDGDDA